jgi:hypothetical protein
MAPLFIKNTHENAASPNLAAGQQKLVGPTKQNRFFLLYQTLICVAVDEPHPRPHYQTA